MPPAFLLRMYLAMSSHSAGVFWSFARKEQIRALTAADWADCALELPGGTVTSHTEMEGYVLADSMYIAIPRDDRPENRFAFSITIAVDN